ncbi:MAG: flagellar filament capping protein FliD [Roseburia sp.]
MGAIHSAYQYYLSTYGKASASRYDTHKKSQLRAIYNDIVKKNKETPLYKIKYSEDVQKFAIDIKEKTRSIQNMIASLSEPDSGIDSAFSKKIAQSTDEDAVSAEYIGSSAAAEQLLPFQVEVHRLATPQVNLGTYLNSAAYDLKPGSYGFELNTGLGSYEFQFGIDGKTTNLQAQEKIIRLINGAHIGLTAELVSNDSGQNAIRILSLQTGAPEDGDYIFELFPSPDAHSIKAIDLLGIGHVEELPKSSSFLLNGTEHTASSNTFTINNAFELTLKKESAAGIPAEIGFKTNTDAIADNVQSLVDVYNSIIGLSHESTDAQNSNRLFRDMADAAKTYYNELEAVGLQLDEEGYLSIDRNLLTDSISSDDSKDCFASLNKFKDLLNAKAAYASIDPMTYVNKIMVAYKNPGHNFATPYVLSVYSGMMLDCYC